MKTTKLIVFIIAFFYSIGLLGIAYAVLHEVPLNPAFPIMMILSAISAVVLLLLSVMCLQGARNY